MEQENHIIHYETRSHQEDLFHRTDVVQSCKDSAEAYARIGYLDILTQLGVAPKRIAKKLALIQTASVDEINAEVDRLLQYGVIFDSGKNNNGNGKIK